jgi:putative ABC transport system permease protein
MAEVRVALRSLRKEPGSTAVAIAALAVGIAACATVFSVVDGVLLRPLPFRDLDRLVAIWKADPAQPDAWRFPAIANFVDWQAESTAFDVVAVGRNRSFTLTSFEAGGTPLMQEVSCGYFPLLGVAPVRGRAFTAEECAPGGPPALILSHELWQRLFAADPAVVGKTTELDGRAIPIVGVMPPGFDNPVFGIDVRVQAWLPLQAPQTLASGLDRRPSEGVVLARLRPGVSLEQAREDLAAAERRLRRTYPEGYENAKGVVVPIGERLTREARRPVLLLLGAVGFLMLVALANVGNIALTRAIERQREIAVRRALGASPVALFRQLLAEGLVLAAAGGALGLAAVPFALRGVDALIPRSPQFPRFRIEADLLVVLFVAGLVLVAAALLAMAPLGHLLRGRLEQGLGVAATRATADPLRSRLRGGLVAFEVALSLVLLIGSGLMLRSLATLYALDPGLDPARALTFRVSTRGASYQSAAARGAFFSRVLAGLRERPEVASAGAATIQPFLTQFGSAPMRIEGRPDPGPGREPRVQPRQVLPGFTEALGIPLLEGRTLAESDDAGSLPVAVISRELARRHFGDSSPIGEHLTVLGGPATAMAVVRRIVGVVGDVRSDSWPPRPAPVVYVPYAQDAFSPSMLFVARARGTTPGALLPEVERVVRSIDRGMPVYQVQTLEQALAVLDAQRVFFAWLLVAFALLSLGLAASGLYAVVSYLVARRTREIGVRMALGARPRDVLRLVVGDGVRQAAVGVGIGLPVALALTRVLEGQLYGVRAHDPLTYLALSLALLLLAAAASALPARRAARTDPRRALSAE